MSTRDLPSASTSPDRRSVLRGAAWSTPIIALAVSAPARAASKVAPVPGINGWIQFGYPTSSWGSGRVTLDARGQYPERGLWINDVTTSTVISDMHIVFHFPASAGNLTFTQEGTSKWAPLTKTGTIVINGTTFNSYRSDYTGSLPLTPGRTLVPNDFYHRSNTAIRGAGALPYIDRFVTIDGTVQSFRRQVGGNGDVLPTTPYSPTRTRQSLLAEPAPDMLEATAEDAELTFTAA